MRIISSRLNDLATLHACSKWGPHWYAQHYQKHFFPLRPHKLHILELGVGGYDDPYSGGESLRMWSDFFPNSYIYGIDVHPKRLNLGHRIKVFQGDQTGEIFLHAVVEKVGGVDIVIDDAKHSKGLLSGLLALYNRMASFLDAASIQFVLRKRRTRSLSAPMPQCRISCL